MNDFVIVRKKILFYVNLECSIVVTCYYFNCDNCAA